jgi:hypothetical protein
MQRRSMNITKDLPPILTARQGRRNAGPDCNLLNQRYYCHEDQFDQEFQALLGEL